MATALFQGCATALITPFRGGEVDYPSLEKLVDFQLENGVDGILRHHRRAGHHDRR